MGIALIVVLVLLIVIGGYLALTYNRLVGLRNRVETAWSQIDVQLKRRYDLIPNLVETVRGYASHERETLEAVIEARQQAIAAPDVQQQAQAENMLTGMLRQLFALSEAYPDLKANENFASLQDELTQTEEQIAFARRYYNERVLNVRQLDRDVPVEHRRGDVRLRGEAVLRGRDRVARAGAGRLRHARLVTVLSP